MSISGAIAALVVVGLVSALTVVIIRFNLRRRRIAAIAARLKEEQLDRIYALITDIGSVPSTGGVLVYTTAAASGTASIVSIPAEIPGFPWAGWCFAAEAGKDVSFRRLDEPLPHTELIGKRYRYLGVPRQAGKSGKERNLFDPARYLKASPALQRAVTELCQEMPGELLSFLLCNGRIEFEPIDQARIGTSPAWVQDPEFQSCGECGKRMELVIQLPGSLVHLKAFHRGTFFLFGCKDHPDQLKSLGQYT